MADFQPFPITKYKTGLFNYLKPWVSPEEAFVQLYDSYIYRGVLQKRSGYAFFGRMSYEDLLTVGNGGKTYSGTLVTKPIFPGSFEPTDGVESFTDNGLGVLTGSAGGTGTINYTTGAWTLHFNANVGATVNIYAVFSPLLAGGSRSPIMGLNLWTNESNDTPSLIACDTKRASVYNTGTKEFDPLSTFKQVIWIGTAAGTTNTTTTGWAAVPPYTKGIAPFSVTITDGTDTIQDDGAGGFTHNGNALPDGTNFDAAMATGAIDYATGIVILKIVTAAPGIVFTISGNLVGDYFTGDKTNFFNATNWQGFIFLTNDKDLITLWDGTNLSRPPFPITGANQITFTNNIKRCLDVDVYQNRFLVIRPEITASGTTPSLDGFDPQSIRWSGQFNPTNLVADVVGNNGGESSAPTDDFIQSSEFLRDQLVVFFANSTWIFRFTGSQFDPFRWNRLNVTKNTNAPYGTVPYDERITAMGAKGLIACDGVNVQRYDISIIDEFLNDINQNYFAQCFGQRFDPINQSVMLYPNLSSSGSSNAALIYNFLENTWANNTYNINNVSPDNSLSCLGTYVITSDVVWSDFASGTELGTLYPNWASAQFPWNEFLERAGAPSLLGGGNDGVVYLMNEGNVDGFIPASTGYAGYAGNAIETLVQGTQWNPFVDTGEKVQFGYIDFYYEIASNPGEVPESILTLNFSTDNSNNTNLTRLLTLDGPTNANTAMKRIYLNIMGEFIQMSITSVPVNVTFQGNQVTVQPGPFKILGMVLWARPAGRFTP